MYSLFNIDFSFIGLSDVFDFSIVDLVVPFFLIYLILWFFIYFGLAKALVIPSPVQLAFEELYNFFYSTLTQQTGFKGIIFLPYIIVTFFTLLFLNFLGLVPFIFTVTSSLIIPFSLALSFNIGFILWGFALHNIRFLLLFVPSGVPFLLLPLIIVIEIMSYAIRTFSLSLRLFANMMAGHALLQILASFVKLFLLLSGLLSFLAIVPFFLVLFVYFLEVGIAFLQAYVFIILLSIYFNDSLNLH